MFKIKNDKTIMLTRGDTAIINMSLTMNGSPYTLQEGDECVLTIKKSVEDAESLVKSQLVNGQFVIAHEDTMNLEYGTYKYDIQFTSADGFVNTIVTPKDFVLDTEVSW